MNQEVREEPRTPEPASLANLSEVKLGERERMLLEVASHRSAGPPVWFGRKGTEAYELLALATVSPNLEVDRLDLSSDFRALMRMRVPVPCLGRPGGELRVVPGAVLALSVPFEALSTPQPGYRFMQILAPPGVHHPNVSPGQPQLLCLGATLPAGITVKELVLASYRALAMQTVQVDEFDPAGVLNSDAARYWQGELQRLPLTDAPFLVAGPGRSGGAS